MSEQSKAFLDVIKKTVQHAHPGKMGSASERGEVAVASKDDLKRLIDQLPEGETDKVMRLIVSLLPKRTSLDFAPLDDEPTNEEDILAVRAGLEEFARGETLSSTEARRRLLG